MSYYNAIVQPVVVYGLSLRLGPQLHLSLQYSKQPLIRTKRFKNLLAEIWRLISQNISQAKLSGLLYMGYNSNILTKEFDFEIVY